MQTSAEFEPFPKLARLFRDVVVTEKIDGTNAQVYIGEDGSIRAGSRTRWLEEGADNFGFAAWVRANSEELLKLGPGRHFGEWWGAGIQRRYGLSERRFSLFNVHRWNADTMPDCCHVVPVLHRGTLDTGALNEVLNALRERGSYAAPGFMKPEGVCVFHSASQQIFKVTCENDEKHKGEL